MSGGRWFVGECRVDGRLLEVSLRADMLCLDSQPVGDVPDLWVQAYGGFQCVAES